MTICIEVFEREDEYERKKYITSREKKGERKSREGYTVKAIPVTKVKEGGINRNTALILSSHFILTVVILSQKHKSRMKDTRSHLLDTLL